jgi:dipeptidase
MCDTFVKLNANNGKNVTIFGKNSDREPNEAQILEYHKGKEYSHNSKLNCTYIEIPQAEKTFDVLISRPFWMWGAEIGANSKGVTIGNEAVFTKLPRSLDKKLTGMDLLRIGLERGATAELALEIIIDHLSRYGQGGPCGFEDKKLSYHNSFIIADSKEAWVLETAGHLWVAKKVKDYWSISNGLTIGEQFDINHSDIKTFAAKKGWLKRNKTFNFSECYSDWFYTKFSSCKKRQKRSLKLLGTQKDKSEIHAAFNILRDHVSDKYAPDSHFLMDNICAHSANPIARHASQSTASFVAELSAEKYTYWATGTSAPCLSLFKPICFDERVLPNFGTDDYGKYNSDSYWWNHEKLHREVLKDYDHRSKLLKTDQKDFELKYIDLSSRTKNGQMYSTTKSAFDEAKVLEDKWLNMISNEPIRQPPKKLYQRYWDKQNRRANINV